MKQLYSWTFSSEKEKSSTWYAIAFSAVIGLAIWGIINKIFIFSFLVFLVAGVYLYVENSSEDEVNVSINEDSIDINNSTYDLSNITSYQIINDWNQPIILRLMIWKKWIRQIDLEIDKNISKDLDKFLPNILEKLEDWELNNIEKFIRYINL